MRRYIIKRIFIALVVLFGITVIDFALMRLSGDPVEIMSGGPRVSEEMLKIRSQNLGLDQNVFIQYISWLKEIVHGNFGYSYTNYQPVSEMIGSHLWPTLILMGSALIVSFAIASAAGIYSAVNKNSAGDHLVVFLAFLGQSVPGFLMAMLLIYLFTVKLGVLPSGGMKTLGASGPALELKYLIMPVAVLSFEMCGRNIRYIRSSMLEILNKPYLTTARAKGMGRFRVIYVHALRNALLPIITVIGMELPGLFGGAVIIEEVFSWPGLGLMTMNAVLARDYPVIMAVCLLSAVVVLAGNLLTDIIYALADPTVRLG